jgi:hypothetical protein
MHVWGGPVCARICAHTPDRCAGTLAILREKYSAWDQNFEEDEHRVANGKTRDFFCCGPIQNQEQPTIFPFYP